MAGCMAAEAQAPEAEVQAKLEAEEQAKLEAEEGVVLRVEVERDHTVTFRESAPGALLIIESMLPSQRAVLGEHEMSNALLAFERLRPGEPVPESLQASYARARSKADSTPSVESPEDERPVASGGEPSSMGGEASSVGALSAASFVNNHGGCAWWTNGTLCRLDWNDGFYTQGRGRSALCRVDHFSGNGIVHQVWGGSALAPIYQAPGTFVSFGLGIAGPNVYRGISINNAIGDGFHVTCHWSKNPLY